MSQGIPELTNTAATQACFEELEEAKLGEYLSDLERVLNIHKTKAGFNVFLAKIREVLDIFKLHLEKNQSHRNEIFKIFTEYCLEVDTAIQLEHIIPFIDFALEHPRNTTLLKLVKLRNHGLDMRVIGAISKNSVSNIRYPQELQSAKRMMRTYDELIDLVESIKKINKIIETKLKPTANTLGLAQSQVIRMEIKYATILKGYKKAELEDESNVKEGNINAQIAIWGLVKRILTSPEDEAPERSQVTVVTRELIKTRNEFQELQERNLARVVIESAEMESEDAKSAYIEAKKQCKENVVELNLLLDKASERIDQLESEWAQYIKLEPLREVVEASIATINSIEPLQL